MYMYGCRAGAPPRVVVVPGLFTRCIAQVGWTGCRDDHVIGVCGRQSLLLPSADRARWCHRVERVARHFTALRQLDRLCGASGDYPSRV